MPTPDDALAAAFRLKEWLPSGPLQPDDDHPYWLVNCYIDCEDVRKVVEFVLAMARPQSTQ